MQTRVSFSPEDAEVVTDRAIGSSARMFSISTRVDVDDLLAVWEEILGSSGYSVTQGADDLLERSIEFSGPGILNAKIIVAPTTSDGPGLVEFDAEIVEPGRLAGGGESLPEAFPTGLEPSGSHAKSLFDGHGRRRRDKRLRRRGPLLIRHGCCWYCVTSIRRSPGHCEEHDQAQDGEHNPGNPPSRTARVTARAELMRKNAGVLVRVDAMRIGPMAVTSWIYHLNLLSRLNIEGTNRRRRGSGDRVTWARSGRAGPFQTG
ncbi:hypothetical protein EF888_16820 [Silicimonas algicola]|uniref:hypothetical protein n=1 Tax=Silicimonas algicola TaxID=1826607 RepID=UPI000F85763D|nr:hypothetical protein [Silicimonas algicola]AZQ68645.1 hypothetical protein EF888_16820 [Silicimonas algicola]